ncbi:MAG: PilZ domain-containing protein [Candidatus Omnitrophica bacterium]|nr:PilZ domain-containing protein [Candidatus Omnitrophota bacterium]
MSLPERRRYLRLNFREPIRFRDVFKPHAYSGALARDLSAGGLRMSAQEFLPKDSKLVVVLDLPGVREPVRTISRVAWMQKERTSDRYDCGLEFVGISREDQEIIAGHIERGVLPVSSLRPALA